MSGWGYQVIETPSAEEAVAALRMGQNIPALIIADYELGAGKTGIDCISLLRSSCERFVPAFLISGTSDGERQQAGMEVLRKPLSPAALQDALLRHLKAHANA